MQIELIDQVGFDEPTPICTMKLADFNCTLRTLITERVSLEYKTLNDKNEQFANHLVNLPASARLSLVETLERAVTGFMRGQYFIFVNDEQMLDLDQEFPLLEVTRVKFFKLIPLAGG